MPQSFELEFQEKPFSMHYVQLCRYFFQTLTLIVSGILVAVRYSRKQKKFKLQKQNKKLNQQQKKSALATIVLMQLGFVVCLRRSTFFFTNFTMSCFQLLFLVSYRKNDSTKKKNVRNRESYPNNSARNVVPIYCLMFTENCIHYMNNVTAAVAMILFVIRFDKNKIFAFQLNKAVVV